MEKIDREPCRAEPCVSIALCTYNGQKWLTQQLDSLRQQSRLPDEVVLSDDCSTDDTVTIAEKFQRDAPFPVHVNVNPRRLGIGKNFEKAIESCNGDLIFACDQDDVWVRNKIERYLGAFRDDPNVVLVSSDSALVDESLLPTGETLWGKYHVSARRIRKINTAPCAIREIIGQYSFLGHTLAFRASLRELLCPIPVDGYDYWITLSASVMGRFFFLPDTLTLYRVHSAQQCAGRIGEDFRQLAKRPVSPDHLDRKIQLFHLLLERLERMADVEAISPPPPPTGSETCHAVGKRLLADKIHLFRERALMRREGLARYGRILNLCIRGYYRRVGRGWLTVARDIIG